MLDVRPETVGVESHKELVTAKISPENLSTLVDMGADAANWLCIGSSSASYGVPHPIIRFRREDIGWFRERLGG